MRGINKSNPLKNMNMIFGIDKPADIASFVKSKMYQPVYS
jgi:hypothetical protein